MSIRIIIGLCALLAVALGKVPGPPDTVPPTAPPPVPSSTPSPPVPTGGPSTPVPPCTSTFDAAVECPKCDFTINPMGYFADECDEFKYYQCYQDGGPWRVYNRTCAPCTAWSQDDVTCVHHPGPCQTVPPPVVDVEVIDDDTCSETVTDGGVVTVFLRKTHVDQTKYIVFVHGWPKVRPCAPGTAFNLTTCRCTIVIAVPPTPPPQEIMCIDFDSHSFHSWGFNTRGGSWVSNNGGVTLDTEDGVKNNSGKFDGAGKLEIPYFTNNYNYANFSVSLWYKRAKGSDDTLTMGLLSNGACETDGSLVMYSETGTTVQMRADSEASMISTPFTATVSAGEWHHLALVFESDKVTYYVNNQIIEEKTIDAGNLANSHCPLSLGLMEQGKFLTGNLDEVCFYKHALTPEQVKVLCDIYNGSSTATPFVSSTTAPTG